VVPLPKLISYTYPNITAEWQMLTIKNIFSVIHVN
jgi:hypothetical protein